MKRIIVLSIVILLICNACSNQKKSFEFTYPNGKFKALVLSYDDGTIKDIELVKLFNQNNLVGTFNLNSGFLGTKRGWPQKNEDTVYQKYVPKDSLSIIYKNHEIAAHGTYHQNLGDLTESQILEEIESDIKSLSTLSGRKIISFAYPFGKANKRIAKVVGSATLRNGRTVSDTRNFKLPKNHLLWNPTCHDSKVLELIDDYIALNGKGLSLFYVWGHSWEFKDEQRWTKMKTFCERIGKENDIWFVGNGELTLYLEALKKVTINEGIVSNPIGNPTIWMEINDEVTFIPPGNSIKLKV